MIVKALKPHLARLVALLLILSAWATTRLPRAPSHERARLESRFAFAEFALPATGFAKREPLRPVNPSLHRLASWISSVGAAVALGDLDGDGLANDVCHVDPRRDHVSVFMVPESSRTPGHSRYQPIVLDPGALHFDSKTMAPMGCVPADFDEDGDRDLLVYYWGRTPILYVAELRSRGPAYRASEVAGRDTEARWFTNAATTADLDGDGHLDVIIGNYFEDGATILDQRSEVPDHMQHSMSRAFNGGTTRFLLSRVVASGAGRALRFEDVRGILPEEVDRGWTLAVGAADLDGDLLPEVYFANDFGPDRLLHNRSRPGRLEFAILTGGEPIDVPSSKALGQDSFKGMGVDFGDIDGDGHLDIYVSNIADEYALEESHFAWINTGDASAMARGRAPFVDRSEPLGLSRSAWSWESRLADFDNDGVLEAVQATGFVKGQIDRWPELQELAMGNDELLQYPEFWPRIRPGDDLSGHVHNPFFVQTSSGRYVDIAAGIGLDRVQVTRGIATADVDGDGDLDFAIANQWEPSYFYRNECERCGASLVLNLLLPVSDPAPYAPGRPAIGASVHVALPSGRILVSQVDGGNGHSGVRSPEVHFGLGDIAADLALPVRIRWRNGNGSVRETTRNLISGRHTIVLGEELAGL